MARGLFITGTGTGVGKTYVGALIARALRKARRRVGVYKPAASGCEMRGGQLVSPDAVALWEAAGRPGTLEQVCPQRFAAPLAPHLAARAEGRQVDRQLLRDGLGFWRESCDVILVEGAGGLMSPLSEADYNVDLAAEFGYPLLVVAANELGTINATLQTLIAAKKGVRTIFRQDAARRGQRPAKIVLTPFVVLNSAKRLGDDPSVESNAQELEQRCDAPLVAVVHHGGGFDREVDWSALAKSG